MTESAQGQGSRAGRPTYSITAEDVGLTATALEALRSMAEGNGFPTFLDAHTTERLRAAGLMEAAGESPKDGWSLTDSGYAVVTKCGTFYKPQPLRPRATVAAEIRDRLAWSWYRGPLMAAVWYAAAGGIGGVIVWALLR